MDIEVAATHEAGHAVVQWLAGGEITHMQMRIESGEAKEPETGCPDPQSYPDLASIRRRLVMLFAGNAATRQHWPDSENDRADWEAAKTALVQHLPKQISWTASTGLQLCPEHRALVDETQARAAEMVSNPILRKAIDSIAATFSGTTPEADGMVQLKGEAVARMCDELVGEVFQRNNPWVDWLDGR